GQIPLCPQRMQIVGTGIEAQARQTFDNLQAIASAADATLDDAVKINISMTDLQGFSVVNDVMAEYFSTPYPARACVQVAALPKGALIEIEAVLEKRGR
ncbi:MAG: RidA family protein, partial [Pseudomonadales bacterium]